MEDDLSEAIAPVLRDLRSAGIAAPRIADRDWMDDPESTSAMLWNPDGSGTGVYVSRRASAVDRVAMVADQVQEWVIEALWGQASTNWPPCPHHPNSHPMRVSVRDAEAVWMCPADETLIAAVGTL